MNRYYLFAMWYIVVSDILAMVVVALLLKEGEIIATVLGVGFFIVSLSVLCIISLIRKLTRRKDTSDDRKVE